MRNVFFSCVILLGFVCGLSAQEQEEEDSDYIISEEDILSVTVRDEPDYTVKERSVRMDGKITMPMVGDIYVSGKTTKQLEAEITEKLKFYIREPIFVQVFVDKVFSKRVRLAGNVVKPGLHALTSPDTTVLDVIIRAGGPTAAAKIKNIKIVRYVNGKEVQFQFNYKDVLRGKNMKQNILLENGDYIMVP